MRLLIAALFALLAIPAFAQQQLSVQDQLYAACGQTNTQLAKMLDGANGKIADLTKQLEAAVKAKQSEKPEGK